MDPMALSILTMLVRSLIENGPAIGKWLASLFPSGISPDEAIQRILAMKTAEEIEAEVDAGLLPEPWKTYRRGLSTEWAIAHGAFLLISLQKAAKAESLPDAEWTKAQKAHDDASAACDKAIAAVEKADKPTYDQQKAIFDTATAELVRIKAQYCPFCHKDKKK